MKCGDRHPGLREAAEAVKAASGRLLALVQLATFTGQPLQQLPKWSLLV